MWYRYQHDDIIRWEHSLVICVENSPLTGEFPAQRPVMQSFDIFFDLSSYKRLSKHSWVWRFETICAHYNITGRNILQVYSTCPGPILWLPRCQWSHHEGCVYKLKWPAPNHNNTQQITAVCIIILRVYCTWSLVAVGNLLTHTLWRYLSKWSCGISVARYITPKLVLLDTLGMWLVIGLTQTMFSDEISGIGIYIYI